MTSVWPSFSGLMSMNAIVRSSSYTRVEGIWPSRIRQNTQSTGRRYPSLDCWSTSAWTSVKAFRAASMRAFVSGAVPSESASKASMDIWTARPARS